MPRDPGAVGETEGDLRIQAPPLREKGKVQTTLCSKSLFV